MQNQQQTLRPGDLITIVGRSLRYEAPEPNGSRQPVAARVPQTEPRQRLQGTMADRIDRLRGRSPARVEHKLQLWNEHYAEKSISDLRAESPPSGLHSGRDAGRLAAADPHDLFTSPSDTPAFSRMAAQVRNWQRAGENSVGSNAVHTLSSRKQGPEGASQRPRAQESPRARASPACLPALQAALGERLAGGPRASPLKRTVSGQHGLAEILNILDGTGQAAERAESREAPENSDVPTEPEPESDPEPASAGEPSNADMLDDSRKSVRFGPPLSPEVFDAGAPPSTPLRRGTPVQLTRVSSILRQSDMPGTPAPWHSDIGGRLMDRSISLNREWNGSQLEALLRPKMSRRQQVHQYLAELVEDSEDGPSSPLNAENPKGLAETADLLASNATDIKSLSAFALPSEPTADTEPQNEPIVDIEPPIVLSPDRTRRRRSLRAKKRVSLDSKSLEDSRADKAVHSSAIAKRRERRRTAPVGLDVTAAKDGDFAASIAELARALGEDVPVLASKEPKIEPESKEPREESKEEPGAGPREDDAEPLPPAVGPLSEQPLGLADAMQRETQGGERRRARAMRRQTVAFGQALEDTLRLELASDALLSEQAAVQARIAGASHAVSEGGHATQHNVTQHSVAERMSQLSVNKEEEEVSVLDGAMLLAHRQRLRRLQERRRRRQTVAELRRRRSSWRGDILGSDGEETRLSSANAINNRSTITTSMYPPKDWDKDTKKRGIKQYVVGALGLDKGDGHKYPPRPSPIEQGWVEVDGAVPQDSGTGNNEVRLTAPVAPGEEERLDSIQPDAVEPQSQVELFAVEQAALTQSGRAEDALQVGRKLGIANAVAVDAAAAEQALAQDGSSADDVQKRDAGDLQESQGGQSPKPLIIAKQDSTSQTPASSNSKVRKASGRTPALRARAKEEKAETPAPPVQAKQASGRKRRQSSETPGRAKRPSGVEPVVSPRVTRSAKRARK
ncbi:hypothetical protein GGI26_001392 [Coemansia sp. RSA 1358]|nr:hypothetical protein GGI26_001392 [Coemansia sp. RSA 1358]